MIRRRILSVLPMSRPSRRLVLLLPFLLAAGPVLARDGWRPIFDGRTLDGWTPKIRGLPLGTDDRQTFTVKGGAIRVSYAHYPSFDLRFAHLFYRAPFRAFHLRLDYRFLTGTAPGAPEWARVNSGIMFYSQAPATMTINQPFPVSVEFQLLGPIDGSSRPTGAACTPGTRISESIEHCLQPTKGPTIANGRWVRAELIVDRAGSVTHKIDGRTVLAYRDVRLAAGELGPPMFPEPVAAEAGAALGGYIALQGEGHEIEFRNIRIKAID